MFAYLNQLSRQRSGWLLLSLTGLALEATALYFQHGMGLVPCVMCIYERLAVLAVVIAGFIGAIAPRRWFVRFLALGLGLYGAIKGLFLAIKHTDYQLHPSPWNTCEAIPQFPESLPLHQWFPNLFAAGGSCNEVQWQMLGWTMPQWLIVAFAIYTSTLGLIALSQFKRERHARQLFR